MLQLLWQVIICTHILGHGPAMWQQFREAVRLKEPMWHKKSNNIFKQIHMHSISQLVNARCAQNCNLSMLAHWLQHWLKNKIWCVGSPLANKHWEGHWGEEPSGKGCLQRVQVEKWRWSRVERGRGKRSSHNCKLDHNNNHEFIYEMPVGVCA